MCYNIILFFLVFTGKIATRLQHVLFVFSRSKWSMKLQMWKSVHNAFQMGMVRLVATLHQRKR